MFITASNLIPTQTALTAGMGILPFFPNQHMAGQAGLGPGNTQEKQPASMGMAEGNFSGSQVYLQSFPNLTAGGLLTGHHKQQQSQPKGTEISSGVRKLCVCAYTLTHSHTHTHWTACLCFASIFLCKTQKKKLFPISLEIDKKHIIN